MFELVIAIVAFVAGFASCSCMTQKQNKSRTRRDTQTLIEEETAQLKADLADIAIDEFKRLK